MRNLFWRTIARIEARFDKPADQHNLIPGSEKMVRGETPKAWSDGARTRRSGSGLGPRERP